MPVLKIILLGDTNVGKTSFIRKYMKFDVHAKHKSTIGTAMFKKNIEYNNTSIDLNIWDTAGQERYTSLTSLYYRASNIAIIMYDVTNPQSFIRAKEYLLSVKTKGPDNIIIGLIGNKNDIAIKDPSERAIPFSVGKEWADTHHIFFAETNSFSDNDAKSVFGSLLDLVPNDIIYYYTGETTSLLDEMIDSDEHRNKNTSGITCCNIS
jgi:Ras-related protein Rab-5C